MARLEPGGKLRLFDQRVRANLAAYYIDWSNMQIPLVRSSDQAPYVGNIGKARSIGIEGEILARTAKGLELGLNFQLQNAKVVSLTADQALISGALLNAKLASPDFKIGGYLKQTWELGNGSELFARVDVQHIGSYANGFPNTPGAGTLSPSYAMIPSYEKLDASIGWTNGQVGATLYAENLTDSKKVIFINPANFSLNRYGTLRPRVIGLRLSYRY
ncbi:TonB-dependent receptor domain-containing protein [Novosphingobium sp.]|uniref:TonB-dependent receptor domain-containing protein n=1 Tax=Novosphingobium sp. TaxID=1874826 RepID=UPI0035B17DC3